MNKCSLYLQKNIIKIFMSPRIKRFRKVLNPPLVKGFKPYGLEVIPKKEPIYLYYEEYEALRLCDYDLLNHHQSCVIMGVSRPTFTRIYASLRQKIAAAFVEGRPLVIEGGKVYFDSEWYSCKKCLCFFNNPEKEIQIHNCPLCKSVDIAACNTDKSETDYNGIENSDICVCPQCGYEQQHQLGVPCNEDICPKCKSNLRRKRKIKYR